MKTTIEIPEQLLREAKAAAARDGRSLRDLLTAALRDHLQRSEPPAPGNEAWRLVFGKAGPPEVRAVDEVVSEELEQIELETWR